MIESTFQRVTVQYCLLTGIYIGEGYTNTVDDCVLLANGVQLALGAHFLHFIPDFLWIYA